MKTSSVLFVLLALIPIGCGQVDKAEDSDLDGYFATKKIADAYQLYATQPDYNSIYSYVIDSNPNYYDNDYDAFHLTDTIEVITKELKIDAFVFASMLRKESNFKRTAVSPTGAVGFSQMTTKAITEVNDQLGVRGTDGARADTTAYFRGKVIPAYELVSGKTWKDLWTVPNAKNELKADGDTSVVYGAVMLKTLLAVAKQQKPAGTMKDWYTQALEAYNGDVNKATYREKILNWSTQWSNQ